MNITNILLFLIPIISSYLMSYLCKIDNKNDIIIKARPDPIIFMIVWPILYILIGLSWVRANNANNNKLIINLLYGTLVITLCLWIYFYGCQNNKKIALYTLLLSILIILITLLYNPTYLLLPLLVWLFFALLLNFEIVNKEQTLNII